MSPYARLQVATPPHTAGVPSQSSSWGVWQSSTAGTTSPVHAPKAVPAALQVFVPPLQGPTPAVPAGPS